MSKINGKVLILDDDEGVLFTAKMTLQQHFQTVVAEKDPKKLDFLLNQDKYDVVVLDMNISYGLTNGKEGLKLLKKVIQKDPDAHVLMNAAYGDIEMAVEAIKQGAKDFLVKPWQKEKLLSSVSSIFELKQTQKKVNALTSVQKILLEDQDKSYQEVISASPAMKPVLDAIQKVSETDANVLITGEQGTGKEMVARAIHRQSMRTNHHFIKLDLGTTSEDLFDAALFGSVSDTFADVNEDRPGKFEIASGGTLFLDEIGNLSTPLQAKLLTALQFKQISRLGSNDIIPLDSRLICAADRSLYDMVSRNKFRQDLLHRINAVEIELPPLRERVEDIEPLAKHFLKVFTKKYRKNDVRLNDTTLDRLKSYAWPGNIKELQLAMERAVLTVSGSLLMPKDFFLGEEPSENTIAINSINIEDMEKVAIQNAVRRSEGNLTQASKKLGFGRSTLYRKMAKYGL